MKNLLHRFTPSFWWYDEDGEKHTDGATPPNVRGNLSYVRGNLSYVRGDLSNVSGDLSYVRGNLSNVSGDLSYVRGNVDDCEITEDERKAGVSVESLISNDNK